VCLLDSSGSGEGLLAGSCEHDDTDSSSEKRGNFLNRLATVSFSRNFFCCCVNAINIIIQ
jgi:hypothetical protein